ncbi:predicted protein [Sclerotinia sclerotiorum 1980 UF-70]|uniref:Uncharacterized protein n=1 Tax=Sclerotinia sclerotiorum (strain ATCC 18683 / 1980 / Ss-1) TaxID=665079 RepID=A7EB02_SCLS1|nr:predicted protein [Sclerotinia sclerotiorum 1980 UF-70]EDN99630.1 predicted protein [Sclerotinia sclerotiorum 1980 UF-70]
MERRYCFELEYKHLAKASATDVGRTFNHFRIEDAGAISGEDGHADVAA